MIDIAADVVVVGAGSAGCTAALAARRGGAEVLLVDRLGFPGGTSTAVLDTFYAFFTAGDGALKLVAGLPDLPVERLAAEGALWKRPNSFGSGPGFTYHPEILKIVWTRLLREHGVRTMLHALVVDVERRGDRIERLIVATKAGLVGVAGQTVVDASGDADVLARAGAAMQADVALRQPATLTFRMSNVDVPRFRADGRPRLKELVDQARRDGRALPGDGGSLHPAVESGAAFTALCRVPTPDLDDPLALGELELEGLLQVHEWARFLRDYLPGFERAELSAVAPVSGIRETRRIAGVYTLTDDDVAAGRGFDDQIALCGAPIEDLSAPQTDWRHVGGAGYYGIPWRSQVSAELANTVVAGRCLSASHLAHASARSMATCMALGQAAGTAAALSLAGGGAARDVPAGRLRHALRDAGAIVDADLVRRVA